MKNVIDAINILISGVNTAYSRGAYNMKEVHDIYEAIDFVNKAVSAQQPNAQNTTSAPEQTDKTREEDYD